MSQAFFHLNPLSSKRDTLSRTSLEQHIRASLRSALLTQKGERPNQPHLGCELISLLYRPLSPALQAEVQNQVRTCVLQAEPRILLTEVQTLRGAKASVSVHLRYQIRQTNKMDELKVEINPKGAI